MKKIINNPSNFVEESIDGLIKSHPEVYLLAKDNNRVITRAKKTSKKVGIVTGGGSGHLPVFTGYVGKGFLKKFPELFVFSFCYKCPCLCPPPNRPNR